MLSVAAAVLGLLVVLATALSLTRLKAWWVRVWDFPRVQLAAAGALALAGWVAAGRWGEWPRVLLTVAMAADENRMPSADPDEAARILAFLARLAQYDGALPPGPDGVAFGSERALDAG